VAVDENSILGWLGGKSGQVAIAGLAGAATHAVFEWQGWASFTKKLTIGSTSAYFLSPIGVPALQYAFGKIDIPPDNVASVGGYITGLGGLFIVEILLAYFKRQVKRTTNAKVDDDFIKHDSHDTYNAGTHLHKDDVGGDNA
jgi:hypothetical protein